MFNDKASRDIFEELKKYYTDGDTTIHVYKQAVDNDRVIVGMATKDGLPLKDMAVYEAVNIGSYFETIYFPVELSNTVPGIGRDLLLLSDDIYVVIDKRHFLYKAKANENIISEYFSTIETILKDGTSNKKLLTE